MPVDIDLEGLHRVIQIAIGWENCHLYECVTREARWASPDPDFGVPDVLPATETTLAELLRQGGAKSFCCRYGFGDDWRHTVKVDAVAAAAPGIAYPRLLAARRACPPEDCGGPRGHPAYLEANEDPGHERHKPMKEPHGGVFDPAAVDEAAIRRSREALAGPPSPRVAR